MRSYILVAAAASRQRSYAEAKGQPARLPRRLEGYPACCVEHSYWADGEVTGTTCHGRRSPWDAATMSDLCTAGYSDAGEWAPPFRDCSQAAIDADAGCGTADWETCAVCAEYGIPTGMYFANVGYASCPDWVVNAAYEEAENGGQCVEGLGGVHATSDECFDCRFCFDCEAYGTCDLPVEEKCWGQGAYPACEALWQQCDWNYTNNACREWGYPKGGEWNVDEDCCAGKQQMACADGYRLENTGNVCYEDDCTTAYEYHCIACDPASDCMGNLDEDGEDYGCEDNVCREWGYPKEGEWNVDEDCCAGKKQMACADGYRLENTGNVCNKDCAAYDYHCIACDPASDCMGNLDEKGEDYFCDSHLILVICLPIGVVLICIGCCICHRRRQAQQRQAPAAANAQTAHVEMAPVPKSYAYNTQQRAEEMYKQIAAWYDAPENAALRATWGAYPEPDEFQTWPGFVAVTNAFLDQGAIVGEQQPVLEGVVVPSAPPIESAPPAEEMPWAPPAEEMPWAPPAEEMPPPAPPRNFCSACGAPVQGPFCGQCGARA